MPALIGTSGWNYPTGQGTWNGVFYPQRRPKGFDELAYYAEHFDTVEVNSTFYRVPDAGISRGWLRRTPASFQFSIKLYQKFTHPDMYVARGGSRDWTVNAGDIDEFRRGLDPIADAGRLAALLIQFPPSFHADEDTRAYIEWLAAVLRTYPLAVELRHQSWSDDRPGTTALLNAVNAAWVYIDEPKFASSIRQTIDDPSLSTRLTYVRLHGRNASTWWNHAEAEDRYDYLYSADELRPIAAAARTMSADGRRVVMYLNNHFSAKAVANAAILRNQLGDLLPGEYAGEMRRRYPELDAVLPPSGLLI